MITKADTASLRQFKASIGPRRRGKLRRKALAGVKEDAEPIGSLIRNPGPKAVAPYNPRSEVEDSNLRFLIHHCTSSYTRNPEIRVEQRETCGS